MTCLLAEGCCRIVYDSNGKEFGIYNPITKKLDLIGECRIMMEMEVKLTDEEAPIKIKRTRKPKNNK